MNIINTRASFYAVLVFINHMHSTRSMLESVFQNRLNILSETSTDFINTALVTEKAPIIESDDSLL